MKRLLIWNLLLAVCATAGIYKLRHDWMETRAQEQVVLLRKPASPQPDLTPPPVKPAPFQATSYTDVAQKMLFSRDRNPNVEVVAPPPPPPPPPMPALPHVYGVMELPSGTVAIMSDKANSPQKRVRKDDTIGDFKVIKLDTQKITLQWMDKTVEKSIDELLDRQAVASAPEPASRQAATAPASTPPPASSTPVNPVLGIEIGPPGRSIRACKGDDKSPAGTVVDGYKKSIEPTPFGNACRWLQSN